MKSKKTLLYRWIARAPLKLYRLGLPGLLGRRLLRLHHRGWKTGRIHEVLLEAVSYDDAAGRLVIGSAWGERAQWYRSLLKYPEAEVDFRGQRMAVYAVPILRRHEREILFTYQQTHPILSAVLRFFLGPGAWDNVRLLRLETSEFG